MWLFLVILAAWILLIPSRVQQQRLSKSAQQTDEEEDRETLEWMEWMGQMDTEAERDERGHSEAAITNNRKAPTWTAISH